MYKEKLVQSVMQASSIGARLKRHRRLIPMLALLAVGAAQAAEPNCNTDRHVVGSKTINIRHIAVGEINSGGNLTGIHSIQCQGTAQASLFQLNIQNNDPASKSIYSAQVTKGGKTKSSTFFPNSCTLQQIAKSVQYATQNLVTPQPSVPWGQIGKSGPSNTDTSYCLSTNGVFSIRFVEQNGIINTAFPHQ